MDSFTNCDLLIFFFSPRPHAVFKQAVTLISASLLAIGLYIHIQTWSSDKTTLESCIISRIVLPPDRSSLLPECFLQKFCFSYNLQPQNVCVIEPMLFVFIFSMPSSFDRRKMIRDTWVNNRYFAKQDVQHVFLLGQANWFVMRKIRAEAESHNDIVVLDLKESFCHLTLKGLSGLHFATHFCPSAKYVMKTDDDIFINMFLLRDKLKYMISVNQMTRILMGLVWINGEVFRSGRYAVSRLQYPRSTFPPFCSGSGYIMSMDVTQQLFKLAMEDNRKVMIHLDDPYITGILGNRAKLKHIQLGELYLLFRMTYHDISDDELLRHLVMHLHDEHLVVDRKITERYHLDMWRRLVRLYQTDRNYILVDITKAHHSMVNKSSKMITVH